MSPKERLEKVQAQLDARGIRDIKFTWARKNLPADVIMEDVASALEAYLEGRYHPLLPLNDSVRC